MLPNAQRLDDLIKDAVRRVAAHCGVPEDLVLSQRRAARLVEARNLVAHILAALLKPTTTQLAQLVGWQAHSTAVRGLAAAEARLKQDPDLTAWVEKTVSLLRRQHRIDKIVLPVTPAAPLQADSGPVIPPDDDAPLHFLDDVQQNEADRADAGPRWKILVVDDEPEVHAITRLALRDFTFEGSGVEILSAYSAEAAKECFLAHPDIAMMFTDVVMETDDAGLRLVEFVRRHNARIRIVIRTGHPGLAPEDKVISDYAINDYRIKTEMTVQRLHAVTTIALRGYAEITSAAGSGFFTVRWPRQGA